jgi:RND family efflux transporter MFP subunit
MRAVVPNPDLMLLPGMYVRAVISNAVVQDGLLVPQRGITRDQSGNAIAMVVGADNKFEARIVEVGNTIGDRWVVRSGLAPGDRVIVEGLQKVSPGATVEPTVVTAEAK